MLMCVDNHIIKTIETIKTMKGEKTMARFTADTADNYGGKGGSGFFFLRDDGDVATVRLLYNSVDDVEGHSVHEVTINDKKRYVDCPREYNDPIEDCPFCKAGRSVQAKLIIPVYDETDGTVKIWERGKKFFTKVTSLCDRYKKYPIVSQKFDIERHGVKGSSDTEYEFYRTDDPADDKTLDDFKMPNIIGPTGFILQKSVEDMEYYLEEGYFPPDEEEVVTRSEGRQVRRGSEDEAPAHRRRTPSGRY